jgi:integrase
MGIFKGGTVRIHTGVRQPIRLNAKRVEKEKKPGSYADGAGLYLRVTPNGTRSWVYRFGLNAKTHEMGLGAFPRVSLSEARTLRDGYRDSVKRGINPIEARRTVTSVVEPTFKYCAEALIEKKLPGWRNPKHINQWHSTLSTYVYPKIGGLPVSAITKRHVVEILLPIWQEKNETASRLRGRIEAILDWASAHDLRTGDNPAKWRGAMKEILPEHRQPDNHFTALPYKEIAGFVKKLRECSGVTAAALEFVILTAARTSEALKAKWDEFDAETKEWTIPADRMKAGRVHRVPLSPRVIEILNSMAQVRESDYVFPSPMRPGEHMTDMALLMLVRRLAGKSKEGKTRTTHGFRSSFRDWAAEQTDHPPRVAEAALAHVVGDKTEAAYQRGDLLEKRARLMNHWAEYCEPLISGSNVVPMRASR